MRFLFGLLILTMPAVALAQDVPAQPKVVPGPADSSQAILAIDNGGHSGMVQELIFTRDGKQLISIDVDNTVQLWDAVTGERLKVFRLPRLAIQPLSNSWMALAPDNITLAIGGVQAGIVPNKTASSLSLLHLGTGQLMQLPGFRHDMVLQTLAFSGDGDHLAIGQIGKITDLMNKKVDGASVKVWSGLKNVWKKPIAAPQDLTLPKTGLSGYDRLVGIVFASQGSHLAAHTANGVYRWDLAKADDPKEIKLDRFPMKMALSPDGSRLAVAVFNPKSPVQEREVQVFSADGKLLKSITRKDLPTPKAGAPFEFIFAPPVFRNNQEFFLAVGAGPLEAFDTKLPGALVRCDLVKGDITTVQSLPPIVPGMAKARWTLAPEGKRVAVLGNRNDYAISVLNVDGAPKSVQLGSHLEKPMFVWSKQGYQIAWTGSSRDNLVAALDLQTGALLPKFDPAAFAKPEPKFWLPNQSADRKYQAVHVLSDILKIGKDQISLVIGKNVSLSVYVSGQDWVVWTPEGYYAASPGGEKLVGWHVNNGADKLATFYPVERFRKQLYRPDVIKLVLEKGSVAEALKAADAALGKETRDVKVDDLLPPRAVLTVDQSKLPIVKVKVKAEASVKEQPITSLRLMLDGRIVPGKETLVEFKDGKAKAEVEWTFELPEGDHQLAVLARCPDSSGISQAVRVKNINQAKLPTLHVLTVGINNYKDTALDLKYAAPDAEALAKAFVENCKGQPFRDVKTKTLLNQDATAKNIAKELVEMRKNVAQQDLVIVFFACHGVKHKKEYYLLTHEADVDQLDKTSLSGADLRKSLNDYKCQVLLMLDACHSAGFGEGKKLAKLGMKPATDDVARDLTDDEIGIAVMCAAMAHEKAEGQGGHGLFTQAVLDALAKKPGVPFHPRNQRVYVHHLHTYVFDQVSDRSDDRQHPFLSLPWVVESFVVR
jgi:hypothetical protein